MPTIVVDHHLKDFDAWMEIFMNDPPPPVGKWRVIRGIDDPNRVQVIGEADASEVDEIKAFMASERMQEVFARVNEGSTRPVEFTWFDEVKPG